MHKKNIISFTLLLLFVLVLLIIIFSDKYEITLSFQNSFIKSLYIKGERAVDHKNKSDINQTMILQTFGSESPVLIGKDINITYAK